MSTSGLEQLRNVMNTLRSPGGCPWDQKQTHETLVQYLIEETYELVDAIETGSKEDIKEELGDVLLQVFFHSRIAEEDPRDGFSIDEVSRAIAEKLVRRHPHVFASDTTSDQLAHVEANWQRAKEQEKARTHVLEGVPFSMPAISQFIKILKRLENADRTFDVPKPKNQDDHVGWILYHVAQLHRNDRDADCELRDRVRELRDSLA
ncbi:MAG: MazG family protein [Candidatus Nanopelagicales bacterium]